MDIKKYEDALNYIIQHSVPLLKEDYYKLLEKADILQTALKELKEFKEEHNGQNS